jgi:deoxyadenosine/deoxycytidine kinase
MKPKVIEIIGPPGVGKSTIYQSLCRKWVSGSQWVYPEVLLTSKPPVTHIRKWMAYRMRLLLHKKLVKSIPVDYGLRFDEQQQDLARFCWKHLSDTDFYKDNDNNKRFRSAYFLFNSFCLYQAINEKTTAAPCIIEEGFLQKSFFVKDNTVNDQQSINLLNQYLELVPVPHAIIYIDTPDTGEVVKRLRGRGKLIASHLGKDDDALRRDIEKWRYIQDNIIKKMQAANVQIIKINSTQPVKTNVAQILTKVNELNKAHKTANTTKTYTSKLNPINIS